MGEYIIGNRGGIVYTIATQTDAGSSTTNAIYTLPDHTFRFLGQAGLMLVSVNTKAEDVKGVTIQVNGQTLNATDNYGNEITEVPIGEHLLSFNKANNTIKFFA